MNSSWAPTDKVKAGSISGALIVVIIGVAEMLGVELDEVLVGSVVFLFMSLASYFTTERHPVEG